MIELQAGIMRTSHACVSSLRSSGSTKYNLMVFSAYIQHCNTPELEFIHVQGERETYPNRDHQHNQGNMYRLTEHTLIMYTA